MINKKFTMATSFLFSTALFLGACGNEEQVTEPITEEASETNDGVEDANPEGGLAEENVGGEVFGFTDFELEVEYPDQEDALYVSYEEIEDQVEAEYENQAEGETLSGNDAFDVLEPILAELELTPDMADDEVISQITEAFSVQEDYESIELEITYPEGTNKNYESSGN